MGKLINAKIDVTKIDKTLLFKGEKGTYLDLSIWVNDEPDQYGNDISIQQRTKKDDPKIYLGNGKYYVKRESDQDTGFVSHSDYNKKDEDDLPF